MGLHCERHKEHDPRCLDCVNAKHAWLSAVRSPDEPPVKVVLDPDPVIALCMEAMQLRETSKRLKQFMDFHKKNPSVFTFLVDTIREMRDAGYRRGGFPLAYSRCRWNYGVKQRNSEFELNNDISAHYSRAITILVPEFAGFFEQRKTKGGTADNDFGYVPKGIAGKTGRLLRKQPKAPATPVAKLEDLATKESA